MSTCSVYSVQCTEVSIPALHNTQVGDKAVCINGPYRKVEMYDVKETAIESATQDFEFSIDIFRCKKKIRFTWVVVLTTVTKRK